MKFDNAAKVQEVCWRMRQIESERSSSRAILQRQFNGDPPFDEDTAEENGVQINRNFLKGVQVLADARRQWNEAFLSAPRYFNARLDSGPTHKREGWGMAITRRINRYLKSSRGMFEQTRATGANVLLHGIGPATWKDRRSPLPVILPIDAVYIPTQTEIDFENLGYFALYREYTPAQLLELVSMPKNPGWNKPLAMELIKRKLGEDFKDMANYAEFNPERFEEVLKQDGGYWDSDAVPTVDVLDFYFREEEDGNGWYRRMVLDWDTESVASSARPVRNWGTADDKNPDNNFLYTSGSRAYAPSLSEILHCQFGDCSAYAPFKYHSVRSLGWLLWGVCDLLNRMECRFFEAVFENLMWFFRVSGENDLNRLKKATFHHMGVIPNGVSFVSANDRFVPNPTLIEQGRMSIRSQIAETAASYTHDFDKGESRRELTATETMARVNSINALLSGMMNLAYSYEEYKYREICRRISKEDHPHSVAIREALMREDGVPKEFLNSERWEVNAERVIGAGNKTVEMAAVNFLQGIRNNLGPQAQRKVDNLSIASVTSQPDLADDLAPVEEQEISNSAHDAELAAERILRGLPFTIRKDMVFEEYVLVWLNDLGLTVEKAKMTQDVNVDVVAGMENMAKYITEFLALMGQNPKEQGKIRQYGDALGQIMNHVKELKKLAVERQQQQAQGANGQDAEAAAKIQAQMMQAQAKQQMAQQSHAQKTAQRQIQGEMEARREDQKLQAELQREQLRTQAEIAAEAAKTEAEIEAERQRTAAEITMEQAKNAVELEAIRQKAEAAAKEPEPANKE